MQNVPECCGRPMVKGGLTELGIQRFRCLKCRRRTTGTSEPQPSPVDPARLRHLKERIKAGARRFVITSAQNNTRKNAPFFRTLLRYCEHRDAELIVVPIHYKNINLYTASQQYKKFWDRDLTPYLIDEPLDLGGNVVVRADVCIAATAANPLEGKQPIGGAKWTIFGHPQLAMEPVPTPADKLPKRMYTTGAVTTKNYSRTNAGAKAEFHHVEGALVVEVDGAHAFIRQVNADSRGRFYDLDTLYGPDGAQSGHAVLALTTGDEHVKFHKPEVRAATYDAPDSIVRALKPRYIIRHDILDGYAGSHHHEHDDVLQFTKHHQGNHDYRAELDQVVDFLDATTPADAETVIVPSNHHDHLYKWLARVDPRKDPTNALLIHELKAAQYQNALAGRTTDPLEIYLAPRLTCRHRFLDRSKPFVLKGVDYSQHGDVGVNGSRGSARSLAKSTYKMVVGHSHGARIVKGVYQVGTSTGRLEYERGLGDHSNTHCIQYPNGKRTLVDIFDGKWRA